MGLIRRTFFVKAGTSLGTAFAVEYKGQQYLITAKHVVQQLPRRATRIQIFRTENWKDLTVDILTPKDDAVDIAVLVLSPPNERVATQEDASFGELSGGGINLGGQIYFLGYPYGLHSIFGSEYIPLVKTGVLSAVDDSDQTAVLFYIDGFNNEGFSGGPVVGFSGGKWIILGVVKGYVQEATKTRVGKQDVETKILTNSGILIAYSIKHALDAIDASKSPQVPQ